MKTIDFSVRAPNRFSLNVAIYPSGRAVFSSPVVYWDRTFADTEQAYEAVDEAFKTCLVAKNVRMVEKVIYANIRELVQQTDVPHYWSATEETDD